MMPFSPEPLSASASGHLATMQREVNEQADRQTQFEHAVKVWGGRKSGGNQAVWTEIEQKLSAKHPRPGLCQYCEYDRNSPTEHFFPKKHFPERAFRWDNYLLICGYCNSVCKREKFAVFHPRGSSSVFHLPVTRGTYPVPPTDDAVLINPRTEDPHLFMMLDMSTGIFLPIPGTDARGKEKAGYTIDLLHLNRNANLVRYRKKAYDGYLQKLEEYTKAQRAHDFPALRDALAPAKRVIVVQHRPFALEKQRILTLLKNDILDDPFPSVWREIKTQKDFFPEIAALLLSAPEALLW